jgi:hypothetical protein
VHWIKHTNGNVVVIIDGNQVAELQVASHRSSLAGNTLHSASIAEESVCEVVDQFESGLVEDGSSVLLCNGKTDGVGETLAERASGDLNTGGVVGFGMTGSDAVDLLEKGVSRRFRTCQISIEILTRKFFKSSRVTA